MGQYPDHHLLWRTKFAKIGTKQNAGTKIFSLVGKIKNTGLIEVPMGMTIREIVEEIVEVLRPTLSSKPYRPGAPPAAAFLQACLISASTMKA